MLNFIGGVFKYTFIVLAVLVLSHVIEIQGSSISQHVYRTMHLFPSLNPKLSADRITSSFSKTVEDRMSQLKSIDNEISTDDQKALNQVIETSQKRH